VLALMAVESASRDRNRYRATATASLRRRIRHEPAMVRRNAYDISNRIIRDFDRPSRPSSSERDSGCSFRHPEEDSSLRAEMREFRKPPMLAAGEIDHAFRP